MSLVLQYAPLSRRCPEIGKLNCRAERAGLVSEFKFVPLWSTGGSAEARSYYARVQKK